MVENSQDSKKSEIPVIADDFAKNDSTVKYSCGKVAAASAIISAFKPLVYSEEERKVSWEHAANGVNRTVAAAGAAAGIAYAVVNHDDIMLRAAGETDFISTLTRMPLVPESVMALGGVWAGSHLHAKVFETVREGGIPTIADALYGRNINDKGLIDELVESSEAYLKKADPKRYEEVMAKVESKVEDRKERRRISSIAKKLNDSENRVVYVDERKALEKEYTELKAHQKTKKKEAAKKFFSRFKKNDNSRS